MMSFLVLLNFEKMMNNYFDCTNVRSLVEHEKNILFSNYTHPKMMKDFPG